MGATDRAEGLMSGERIMSIPISISCIQELMPVTDFHLLSDKSRSGNIPVKLPPSKKYHSQISPQDISGLRKSARIY